MAKHLPNICKILSLVPSTEKGKKIIDHIDLYQKYVINSNHKNHINSKLEDNIDNDPVLSNMSK